MSDTVEKYKKAVEVLREGGTVAFPTDTVYCLAADIHNDEAVKRVFEIKGRSLDKALPILLPNVESLLSLAIDIPEIAMRLADAFWPGGLTLVLKKQPSLSTIAIAGGDTIAVRIPGHAIPLDIVSQLGKPITGTSANLSGHTTPVTADEVFKQIGDRVDMIIDGGACAGAVVSTIIDLTGSTPKILRDGAITKEQIEEACGIVFK